MKDLGQEALEDMNRLLLNQQRLKMKLERMGNNQLADASKTIERLQGQLKDALDWLSMLHQEQGFASQQQVNDLEAFFEKCGYEDY